jgi:TonB family protein
LIWLGLILVISGMWIAFATLHFVTRFQNRYVSPTRALVLTHAGQLGVYSVAEGGHSKSSEPFEISKKISAIVAVLISLVPEFHIGMQPLFTSFLVNSACVILLFVATTVVRHEIQVRHMESAEIYLPTTPSPPPRVKVEISPPPKVEPRPALAKLEPPKIRRPRVEPRPELKPLPAMQEEAAIPNLSSTQPTVVLGPQVKPTHVGDLNGVKPNPGAQRPATVAALGNPNGGQSLAQAPHGVVGSAGIGNGSKASSNTGTTGHVASAGIAGLAGQKSNPPPHNVASMPETTPPVLLAHSPPEYTSEAKQLKIQGDVVLRVRITTSGEMIVLSVIRGLGHGLDEAATRSASTYKFRPAIQNGQPVDFTTNVIIKFQIA